MVAQNRSGKIQNTGTSGASLLFLQKTRTVLSSFTGKATDALTSCLTIARRQKIGPYTNLYHHCNDLSLDAFIDCLINRNLKRLIKYGFSNRQNLLRAWDLVYSEYCDESDTPAFKSLMLLSREIGMLRSKILTIASCLNVLAYRPSHKCIELLHQFGYKFSFNHLDHEGYLSDLQAMGTRLKGLNLVLTQKEKELIGFQNKDKGDQLTADKFTMIIAVIEKYMGFKINSKELTVSEFVAYRKMFDAEMKAMEDQLKKTKNG